MQEMQWRQAQEHMMNQQRMMNEEMVNAKMKQEA